LLRPQPRPAPAPPRNQRAATPPPPTPTTRGQDASAGVRRTPQRAALRPRRVLRRPVARVLVILGALALLLLCVWAVPLLFTSQELISDIFVTPGPRPTVNGVEQFPNWDKKERVNVLLLGLDTREENNTRSDTMIIVSIDPANKTVGMMSIPRDLWVSIPGFGENRINAAYQFGLANDVPGGGPGLAVATVEQNLDLPIHYFAQIDFAGFQRVVDALDGITVDVPRPLLDNEYPAENFSFMRIYIPAGLQHMDGRTALQYVRSRHADSDLSRNQRQQAVLVAIKQKGLQIGIVSKLNNVLSQLQGAIKTDLSITQAGSLAQMAQQIPAANIHSYPIDANMVSQQQVNGQDVLVPDWAQIHAAVRQMLSDPRLANEGARLLVLNGTTTAGLAGRTQAQLQAAGFNVVDIAQAPDSGQYPRTVIVDYSGGQKPFTVQQLRQTLNVGNGQVQTGQEAARPPNVDLVVIMGDDAAQP
jgi:LCP family protein required for cell wall assembly